MLELVILLKKLLQLQNIPCAVLRNNLAQQLSTKQRSRIQKYGLTMLAAYFESYVDNVSRGNSYKYHHIYEFNEVGDKNSRLFVGTINGNNPVLSYSFKQASKPSNSGYVFKNKAFTLAQNIKQS